MIAEPSLEQEDLQRRMMHYFRATKGFIASKRNIMLALNLNYDAKRLDDHVRFHWTVLRLNDLLRSHGYTIAERGSLYEFREI